VLERVESGAHHVVGIRGALALGDDVVDAQGLENGAHRAAGDDAGTGRCGAQDDLAGAVAALHVMVQRARFAQRNPDHLALGLFGRLADGFRHFAGLAVAEADAALLVADDHKSGEAEAATTLHNLGDAVDVDQTIHKLAIPLTALLNVSHGVLPVFFYLNE